MARLSYKETLDEAWAAHLASRTKGAPTVASLFAGCGGSSLGYSMAGYREVFASDWDATAMETFGLNFPGVPTWQGDIHSLSVEKFLATASVNVGDLDVLDGSPPCQGYSVAGKREFADMRNRLYNEFVRILKGGRPKAFVMENVPGMVKGKMKIVFADCMKKLKAAGYRVSCRLLNAAYFGVPQCRKRLTWIGIREGLREVPSHPQAQTHPISVAEAWTGIKEEAVPELAPFLKDVICHMGPGQTANDVGCRGGFQTRRMFWHLPSLTITKLVGGTGFGALIHPAEDRVLSIAEMKRLGAFPDQFQLEGNYKLRKAQVGNSVPPLMMRAIALHLRGIMGWTG